MTKTRTLNNNEKATILHGLRMIQENAKKVHSSPPLWGLIKANGHSDCLLGCCDHFDEANELNDTEIDTLCEALNLDSVTIPVETTLDMQNPPMVFEYPKPKPK